LGQQRTRRPVIVPNQNYICL
ncbi:hypothetical protein PGANDO_1624, partial [Porphyromonas gingivalis]